jgi:hypothetical protein
MNEPTNRSTALTQTRAFLAALFIDLSGIIELRPIVPDGNAGSIFCKTIDDAFVRIERLAGQRINVYVGIATRRDSRNGKKWNLRAVRALWVDLDGLTDPAARKAAERKLAEFPLNPSMRVWSGGGLHIYWVLVESIELIDVPMIERVERILKGLADALGGDRAATDASRILRVPGTINYPDAKKRAARRTEAPCELIEKTDAEYQLDDFDAFEIRGATPMKNGTSERVAYESTRDATLPNYIRDLITIEPELQARFNRRPGRHADRSPSGVDMSLACALAHWGIPPADIERTLRASRAAAGLWKHDAGYRLTVERAVSLAARKVLEREEAHADG